jgi:hypothetical protein
VSNFVILNLELDPQASDPAAPPDGLVWYNSTDAQYRIRKGGVTYDIADTQYVDDEIAAAIQGLSWQDPVIDEQTTPPGAPSTGDRYIVTATATGAWVGREDDIAEWDGTAWVFTTPTEGYVLRNLTTDKFRLFDGTSWGNFEATLDHGSLLGLGDDDHTQYLLVSGLRPMSGDLDMGTNNVTNVGLVDGVDVSAHAARHVAGGADEIDGDILDIDYSPTNYTPDTTPPQVTVTNELTAHLAGIDNALAGVSSDDTKAGTVLNATFAGNPKQATVTFNTAYASANYAVECTVLATSNKSYVVTVDAKTTTGFTIKIGANNITNLTAVDWFTKPYRDP